MGTILTWAGVVSGIIALALGISALVAYVLMICWNFAVVPTFGLGTVSFWQAWGLMIVASIATSGLRATSR